MNAPAGGMRYGYPPLTPGVRRLLLILGGAFVLNLLASLSPAAREAIPRSLGLNADQWGRPPAFAPLWQLVTYGFLHSDSGLSHLLFNALGLYFFGTMLEGLVGTQRFLTQFLAAVVAGGVVHLVASWLLGGGRVPVVGASGAVLALVCAAAVLEPRRTVLFLFIPVQLWVLAAIVVAGDLVGVLTSLRDGGGSVAHWVHLGGAAWGVLAVKRRWIWADPLERLRRRRAARDAEAALSEEAEVDRLLEKIQREGIGALDRQEKALLKRASARRRG
jgi:membrane associated rhomboid family serine protease